LRGLPALTATAMTGPLMSSNRINR
jgi:hypothetical protein